MPVLGSTALLASLLLPAPARAADGARYLIIAPSSYVSALERLATWKTRKGMLATVVSTAETGYSYREIHDYILEAAETWDPAPEFVLIAADMSVITMPEVEGYATDTYYGNLDDDMFIEIVPGRFPARNVTEAELMVTKTLQYERQPLLDDPEWYGRADLLIYEDYDDDDVVTYFADANWEAGLMKQAQQMQEKMQKMQEELANAEVTGQSGAGLVSVVMNGRHDVKRVSLDDSLMQEDKEILEDLIAAAVNDAVRKIEQNSQEKMAGMTAGMQLPPGFKMPF